MGKLIGKTIAITVASFIGALAIIFTILALACPKVIGNTFSSLGNYSVSVYFYERQYEKAGDFNDLVVLVQALDADRESAKTASYCKVLIVDNYDKFNDYCADDGALDFGSKIDAYEYFYAKYALAELGAGNFNSALDIASDFVNNSGFGYTESNPFTVIVYSKAQGFTLEQLNALQDKMNERDDLPTTQNDDRQIDNNKIDELKNNLGE